MSYKDFMNKVRHVDNLTAKWIMRHFYLLFFQIFLVIIFFLWFVNTIHVIDTAFHISEASLTERILITQSVNTTILVLLLLLNSFWLLFIFNGMQRLRTLLRDVNYNIMRLRGREKKYPQPS